MDQARTAQFESLLTSDSYQAAWRYACRLSTTESKVWRDEAEDLLQEALAHAFLKLHQLREPARFKGWLLRILRTRYLMRWRRQNYRLPDALPAELPEPSATYDPLADRLREGLNRLPAAQRELLDLFYIEELSLVETGQVLGLSPQVVGKRLFRAREALRRQVGQLGPALPRAVPQPSSSKGVAP